MSLPYPEVGGDVDQWGTKLNAKVAEVEATATGAAGTAATALSTAQAAQAGLAGRAPLVHSHAIGDTAGLESALAGKVDEGDPRLSDAREPVGHTHTVSEIDATDDEMVPDTEKYLRRDGTWAVPATGEGGNNVLVVNSPSSVPPGTPDGTVVFVRA